MSQKCVSGAAKRKLKKEKEENMKILLNKVRPVPLANFILALIFVLFHTYKKKNFMAI
jgi:hypothetical protein